MRNYFSIFTLVLMAFACSTPVKKNVNTELINQISNDTNFVFVKTKALEIMKTGFNAGDGYREVWIRDYNTFIELAAQVFPKEELKENLLVFCRMQGEDGNIIDGFTPIEKVGKVTYDFSYSKLETALRSTQKHSGNRSGKFTDSGGLQVYTTDRR